MFWLSVFNDLQIIFILLFLLWRSKNAEFILFYCTPENKDYAGVPLDYQLLRILYYFPGLWIRIDSMRIRIQHFSNCGSGSRVLMTKNWEKITGGNFYVFFWLKITITYSQAPLNDAQATEEAFKPQKRKSSTSKHEISSLFFCGSFLPYPGSGSGSRNQVNAVPCGSGFTRVGTWRYGSRSPDTRTSAVGSRERSSRSQPSSSPASNITLNQGVTMRRPLSWLS